jgi:acyl CoA:acetate/3-ketoacid CoA transferase beta subunit
MSVEKDGLHLLEVHPDYSIEDVIAATEADLIINNVEKMKGIQV